MATVRVGTFNVENLFARYKFNKGIDPQKAVIDGWRADQRHFDICIVTWAASRRWGGTAT